MSQSPLDSNILSAVRSNSLSGAEGRALYRIQPVLEYLHVNLSQSLSIEEIASLIRLSPSRLSHLFKEAIGLSPIQYIRQLRLETAAQLLRDNPYLSVKEIMTMVGVNDPAHFSSDFKSRYGLPPRPYREYWIAKKNLAAGEPIAGMAN